MEFNIRNLIEKDYETLKVWWENWRGWGTAPPKDFLPGNGTSGFIVEKDDIGVVAGFLYTTNSKAAILEWVISNPEYKNKDRKEALELLIKGAENVANSSGYRYMFTITGNQHLINTHEKLGWTKDPRKSHELTKKLY